MVYLLHLDRPIAHARHYLGMTKLPVEERLARHRRGEGARLLAVAGERDIGFKLVRTWEGGRALEIRLKKHGSVRLCPLCNASAALREAQATTFILGDGND